MTAVKVKEEEPSETATRPQPSQQPKKSKFSFLTSPLFLTFLFTPFFLGYIIYGIDVAAYNVWYPLPFFGYFRYDITYAVFFLFFAPLTFFCLQGRQWALALVIVMACFSFLPGDLCPIYYMEKPPVTASSSGIRVSNVDLTAEVARKLSRKTWNDRWDWVHDSTVYALGQFHYGGNAALDRNARRRPETYSLKYGIEPRLLRRARESHYRLRFPDAVQEVKEKLQEDILPKLRGVYAKALSTSEDNIIFGEELVEGLGQPAVVVRFSNILWNWVIKPQTAQAWKNSFESKAGASHCTNNPNVQGFFMPLMVPVTAGLRYWTSEENFIDVQYKRGKMYSFDAETVFSSRPEPYLEWDRRQISMVVQAFGVQCDDGKWVLFH